MLLKIDLIGPSYPFRGGISHYTTLLYKNLKKKYDTNFYSFKRQYPNFLFPGKTDKDYSNFALKDDDTQPMLDSLNPFTWIRVAYKIIKDKPDITIIPWWIIFWAPHFLTIILILKLFSNTKILFICHNVVEHESGLLKKLLSKMVLAKGDFFIVHSNEEKERLKELIGDRNIRETFHPTYEEFNSEEITKQKAKENIGIDDERVILFFGFVREYKGLKYLLEAMPNVLKSVKVKLLIAGEFWDDKQNYIDLISKLDINANVKIIDEYIPNEEIPSYFYASDIVILPYTSVTGSGLVQLAYGFNKPVVVSNIGALSQIVIDKKTGFLVDPEDSQGIADSIIDYYRNYNEDDVAENIRKENYRFTWDLLVNKIESFTK
ncbi:MAG: glycosyltransferase [Candidatus Marinimicrobia bacterium]|nr:glycosyltransferase [Candidatus Neomarinimicrobiota bacterium]